PPSAFELSAFSRMIASSLKLTPLLTLNSRVVRLPLSVIRLLPLSVVPTAMVFGLVSVMLAGFGPQLKPTLPPAASALVRAASVQRPAVPLPTVASARPPRGRPTSAASATANAATRVPGRTAGRDRRWIGADSLGPLDSMDAVLSRADLRATKAVLPH